MTEELKKIYGAAEEIWELAGLICREIERGADRPSDDQLSFLISPISEMKLATRSLTTRAINVLHRGYGMNYMHEVVKLSKQDLKKCRNLGNASVTEIIALVQENGLEIGRDYTTYIRKYLRKKKSNEDN